MRSTGGMVMAKGTNYSQQFKEDAVRYRKEHPKLTLKQVASNLGISDSSLCQWR
jgi:transposase